MNSEKLSSDRLNFRRWVQSDLERILEIYQNPEVYRFMGNPPAPIKDEQEATESIERWNGKSEGHLGVWAIVPKDGEFAGVPVGTVYVVNHTISEKFKTGKYEIGWNLHPSVWGRGFASEAGHMMIGEAKEHGLTRLYAVVYPENTKSRAVCQRLGMTNQGLTEEWYNTSMLEFVLELN